jgi:membrane protease YdiL (CAAX protease family)
MVRSSYEVKAAMTRGRFLRLEWTLSLALIALGLVWASVRELPIAARCQPTPWAIAAGATVGALLWLALPLLFWAPAMRRVRDTILVPFSRSLRVRDIAVIAVLSGASEEFFFRGVLLPEIGLPASSLIFGLLHAVNWIYVAWAALTGAGLGLLATHGGSLVAPVVAHATYNFGALLVLRHSGQAMPPLGFASRWACRLVAKAPTEVPTTEIRR